MKMETAKILKRWLKEGGTCMHNTPKNNQRELIIILLSYFYKILTMQ